MLYFIAVTFPVPASAADENYEETLLQVADLELVRTGSLPL